MAAAVGAHSAAGAVVPSGTCGAHTTAIQREAGMTRTGAVAVLAIEAEPVLARRTAALASFTVVQRDTGVAGVRPIPVAASAIGVAGA